MLCLFLLSVITISLSGIYSEHVVEGRSVEIDAGLLGCVTYCKSIGRKCFSPPRGCGSCLAHFYARDGVCLPDSEAQDDSKSSDASQSSQSLQPSQNSQNSQDSQNSQNSQNTIVEGCPRLQCKQSCNNGHMKNHFNCPICQCLPAQQNTDINPACPIPECATYCPGGYANNAKGCMTCKCKHSAKEREVLNDDIDNLMERFRRIGEKHEEISKDKINPYGRPRQAYRYGLPGYDVESERPRYYQAVRGQKTKMPAWDRGEGLLDPAAAPSSGRGHFGHGRQHHQGQQESEQQQPYERPAPSYHHESDQEPTLEGKHSQQNAPPVNHQVHSDDQNLERVEVPLNAQEHVEKESSPETDVKIAPVPNDIQEQDKPTHPTPAARQEFADSLHPVQEVASMADIYFLAVVAGCSVAGLVGLVVAGVCWYRLQKNVKAASEVEYPAYGITGPTKGELGSPGDRKLAQSAQMYHYQHQKQQMIALEKANGEMKDNGSEDDSEEENEEGDYTVYECPGLAPTGEMEVKNPLFTEETPVTPTPDDRREMK